ncbi:hypothetical protein SAMN02910317_03256 [Ruminococcaceae bacterium FB2012]|nr:hypothetical protein SAMN02910317_03256 [Ruminococcaceae bacterium FB2012]
MKITTFDPMIATTDADPVIEVFRELGFERTHTVEANDGLKDLERFRMKNSGGYHVDIAQIADLPRDISLIRMNVSNLDEAFEFLTARGSRMARHEAAKDTVRTGSSKFNIMVSPSGFPINITQHIKKDS